MGKLSKEQRNSLERATMSYAQHLDVAADWLAGRGLDLEHARVRGLGVVVDPIPGHESRIGRLAIPYLTNAGPVNMTFRCITCTGKCEGHSKYMLTKGIKGTLYGVQTLVHADDWVVLTEGELDALTWHQLGYPAIGISGAEKWQDHWGHLLEDFSRVYVISEGDQAGEDFWDRVSSRVTHSIKVKLPSGEDSNSLFSKYGGEALTKRIRK